MPPINKLLDLIKQGEPVSPGVPNRPLTELFENANYLWELIQAASIGSTVFARQVTVDPTVLVGQPVYFNAATSRFEKALAGITTATDGDLQTADSAQVWGVVYTKTNSTLADILLFGYAKLDITNGLDAGETLGAGLYYLSRMTPGTLIARRPPIAVPVLKSDGAGNVFVNPQWEDLVFAHTHRWFKLQPVPAGSHHDPGNGGVHVITDPNPAIEGWLPVDWSGFAGKYPHDAKFGYNIAANPSLARYWPPLNPDQCVLLQDGVKVPSNTKDGSGLVIFDRNGIWWMSNCYQTVPWPPEFDSDFLEVSLSASDSYNACPFADDMTLELGFTQFAFLSEDTVVTSLTSNDKRVVIECAYALGTPASVGPLNIRLELSFLFDDIDPGGYLAFKSFDPATQTFHRGPVTTGVYARSDAVLLVSDFQTQEALNSEAPTVKTTIHHGRVGVDVDSNLDREFPVELVRLEGVLEEYYANVMFLGFPAGDQTDYRGRIRIPETLTVLMPELQLIFRLMGDTAGNLPPLQVTYRRIQSPGAGAMALPLTDLPLTINTTGTLASPYQYIEVTSNPVSVQAGDDFLFTVTRLSTDAYTGEVGVLRHTGLIVSGG